MRYHQVSILSVLAAAALGCLATHRSRRWDDMRPKHSWNAVPGDWESLGHPPAGTVIDLHIALKPHHENALIDALYEVSNPGHPKYGAHLSKEQVARLVAPHPRTLELVHSWLEHHSVPSSSVSVTHGGSALTLTGVSVSQANDLLGASYQFYKHAETSETIVRTVGYALPAVLHGHVQTVAPTTYFACTRKYSDRAASGQAEEVSRGPVRSREYEGATPALLRWQYSTFAYVPAATDRNVLGISGYGEEYPSPTDLVVFMRKYRSAGTDTSFAVVKIGGGGYDPNRPGIEGSLNMQIADAMVYPTPLIYYSTGFGLFRDSYLTWLDYMLDQPNIPQTISTSYGDMENFYPEEYATYVCNLFAQLGARGTSVLFSSGNDGVGKGDCKTDDGTVQFVPNFPATCPWITAVGGTKDHIPEVAAGLSGGGFSNFFARPNYQEQAVSTFLKNLGNQYQGLYNTSGRGVPDIAAQALYFKVIIGGYETFKSGTSGSTPVVASIISLLNDHLLSEGKAPLGFLNPWLYSRATAAGINDITSGSNPGCNTAGFAAVAGWDPVTGRGTPDFEHLLYILDLANPSNQGTVV